MLGEPRTPRLSTGNLHFLLFLSLNLELQEEIINHLGETGTTWHVGETLYINGVLFKRNGTRVDTIFITLNTHLGHKFDFVKEVRLIPYLFESEDQPF